MLTLRLGFVSIALLAACSSPDRPAASAPSNVPSAEAPAEPPPPASGKLRVTSIEARTGDAAGGQVMVIKGEGFVTVPRAVTIYFGQRAGRVLDIAGDDVMLVETPGGTPGEVVDVRVVFDPGGELTLPRAFTFVQPAP